ncbi:hypothetical protein CLIB1444_03S02344 [[Candida] jaroonii]|uniref:Uncharacterized protein n=1 Tax=[Candida] jaroonii TaxID=467808 RepID=A0ACA9Y547_9ASCO|nr:hypothetical protein CLIB1444_03S02344 [[Candida] jaroonii]
MGVPYNLYGNPQYYQHYNNQESGEDRRLNPPLVNQPIPENQLGDNRYYYPRLDGQNHHGEIPIQSFYTGPILNPPFPNHPMQRGPGQLNENVNFGFVPMNYNQPHLQSYLGPYSNRTYDTDPSKGGYQQMMPVNSVIYPIPTVPHNINHLGPQTSNSSTHSPTPNLPNLNVPTPPNVKPREPSNKRKKSLAGIYKPTKPKENFKPRINKLSTSGFKNNSKSPIKSFERMSEISIDPLFLHFQNSLKISKEKLNTSVPPFFQVKNDLERKLFDLFVHQVSRCMDMFMIKDFFTDIVPQMALMDETGMILSSMFTLSALMLQRVDPSLIDESIPMNYYHETIRSIRHHISNSSNTDEDGVIARCLLSTILLCVYEMFFLATDNTYVKGAASLLTSIINKYQDDSPLTSSPFLQMCFWAMFVCDLILSLKFNLPTMFSVNSFWRQIDPLFIENFDKPKNLDEISNDLFLSRTESIWWLHKALLDFSVINEFNYNQTVQTEEDFKNNKSFNDWKLLNNRINEYGDSMPLALKPLIYQPSSDDSSYPTIYFRDELSALIHLQFKLSKISLYQGLIQRTDVNSTETQKTLNELPSNHAKLLAKDIIGILKTYDLNLYLWPINIHTIRVVARYLHEDEEEYKELESLMERVIDTCHFIFQSKVIIG